MSGLSALLKLAPYHFLTYATLLGTELYQTFVMTKVCYSALPMSAFTTLQKRVFPVYFQGQTLLLVLTAATFPPYGPVSLAVSVGDLTPLTFAGAMAVLNLLKYGPQTQRAMVERIHQGVSFAAIGEMRTSHAPRGQGESCEKRIVLNKTTETRDGRKFNDGVVSEEMRVRNKAFSHNHAMSIHLNLLAIVATLWYGFRLASKLKFD